MNSDASKMRFGSLFSGIGGMDLGLERAGMECAWQVEIDLFCQRVLRKHWPNVPKYRDVQICGGHNLERVDLIAGGFPCQDISYAGNGAGINGERSGLWSEMFRIVCELRPNYVLVENVAALLNRGMGRVLGDLANVGYDAEWDCIPAGVFGATHKRERVFLVAYPSGERRPILVRDRGLNEGFFWMDASSVWPTTSSRTRDSVIAWLEKQSLDESPLHRVGAGVSHRMDRLKSLGNAVVPKVAEWIGKRILEVEKGGK